jgi:SAM-dependent methyltransferase
MKPAVPVDGELKARAFAYYNTRDPSRWGREDLSELKAEIVDQLQKQAPKEGVVLELGCGKGALRGCHSQYVGVDISFPALKEYLKGARVLQADIEQLPLKDRSARMVVSVATLEHVPHPERVLHEIDRVLVTSGIAVLAPAWFCRAWAAQGLPVKAYAGLKWADRVAKASLPIRNCLIFRALRVIPQRLVREIRFALKRGRLGFEYQRLTPNLKEYVYTDCDAFISMDPHSLIAYFRGRGYEIMNAGSFWSRVLIRSVPAVIRKLPEPATG